MPVLEIKKIHRMLHKLPWPNEETQEKEIAQEEVLDEEMLDTEREADSKTKSAANSELTSPELKLDDDK